MRASALLVALLLVPSALADLELHNGPERIDATSFVAVVQDDAGIKFHQNMAVTVEQDGRVWFTSETLHEHDGIGTFTVGLPGVYNVHVDADGESAAAWSEGFWDMGNYSNFRSEVKDDGWTLSQPVGTLAEWVVRGDQGVWLRGWLRIDWMDESPFEAIALQEDVEIEYRVYGISHEANYVSGAPEPMVKSATEDPWPACTADEVRLDPETVHVGNPVRLTVGDLTDRNQPSTEYRLLRDVPTSLSEDAIAGSALQEETIMAWRSDGPAGATSFRVPSAGLFRLQVEDRGDDIRCELVVDATEDAVRVIEVEDDQVASWAFVGDDLVFATDVPGSGHYEHPMSVAYQDGTTSFMIWAGKLHSHGGPVTFTIPDPMPGNYTVRWDTGAQGPDPIVPAMEERRFTVVSADVDGVKGAPAPLGALALLAVALLVRRR